VPYGRWTYGRYFAVQFVNLRSQPGLILSPTKRNCNKPRLSLYHNERLDNVIHLNSDDNHKIQFVSDYNSIPLPTRSNGLPCPNSHQTLFCLHRNKRHGFKSVLNMSVKRFHMKRMAELKKKNRRRKERNNESIRLRFMRFHPPPQ
jgi:hypothetical protein